MAIPSFTMSGMKRALTLAYMAGQGAVVIGQPGAAKSSMARQLVQHFSDMFEVPFGLIEYNMTSEESTSFSGFYVPSKDTCGRAVTVCTLPQLHTAIEAYEADGVEHGIVLFDELTKADELARRPVAALLNHEPVSGHALSPAWFPIATGNRTEDKSGDLENTAHMINRVFIGSLNMLMREWQQGFAVPHGVHSHIVSCLQRNPDMLAQAVPDNPEPYCTYRSITKLSDMLQHDDAVTSDHIPWDDTVLQSIAAGVIGEDAAAKLWGYLQYQKELPDPNAIKQNPGSVKVPGPERMDVQFMLGELCARHATLPDEKLAYVDSFMVVVNKLTTDIQVSAVQRMYDLMVHQGENPDKLTAVSKQFKKWWDENASLVLEIV